MGLDYEVVVVLDIVKKIVDRILSDFYIQETLFFVFVDLYRFTFFNL